MKTVQLFCILMLVQSGLMSQGLELPFTEDFDSNPFSNGWEQYRLGADEFYDWSYATGGGDGYVSHDYPVGAEPTDTTYDWMVSPAVNLSGATYLSFHAEYFYFMQQPSDYFGIWASTGSEDPDDGDYVEIVNLTNQASGEVTFEDIEIDITGGEAYIAFVYRQTNNWYTLEIDDIMLELQDPNHIGQEITVQELTLYPNPVSAGSAIHIQNADHTFSRISVYSMDGQLVKQVKPNEQPVLVSTTGIPPGLYALEILCEGAVLMQNLVITR